MTNRDNFLQTVKTALANRVGHCCSNPECRKPTIGPSSDEGKFINSGVAAHITAAAPGPGAARYDAALTSIERRAFSNGIWLCGICATIIDRDENQFTTTLLQKWKREAEERARLSAFTDPRAKPPTVVFELDDAGKEFLRDLMLPAEDDIETVTTRMRAAAEKDIEAFVSAREWPDYVIPLNLTLLGTNGRVNTTLDGIANGIGVAENLCLISPPGTGKTTTMVQLAESILNAGQSVAVFVPLGEWSNRQETWFESFKQRNAFRAFKPEHFMQLAYHGRLVLLLDGWNELNPDARKRAQDDLKAFKRDFPQLGIVIGTRRGIIPMTGAVVEIEALSDDQQIELTKRLNPEAGEVLLDQAWRTPGVRELISIPFYLNALLTGLPSGAFPQTKEAILDSFIKQQEALPDKKAILQNELLGFHKDILIGLAVETNNAKGTTLPDAKARPAISDVVAALIARKQLTTPFQPSEVLDVLVNTHSLVRSSNDNGSVAFQHQQLQEWYASFEVERLMVDALQGDNDARKTLQTNVLNWLAWEESILFACERLSHKDATSLKAVAAAISDAMRIDPMLAAEMIYHSAPEVWPHISEKTLTFVKRWHKPGVVDRAVRFMITTGRAEFSEEIWPLITNSDNQIYLEALQTAKRFRPSVLGHDAAKLLAELPERIRFDVIAGIGQHSGYDGTELVVELAKIDKDPNVVVEIVQLLQFRRAERHVNAILQSASEEVWWLIAEKGYPDKFSNPSHAKKVMELQKGLALAASDPIQAIGYLNLEWVDKEEAALRLKELLESKDFPIRNDSAHSVILTAFEHHPKVVTDALMQRIATGLALPYYTEELLEDIEPVDNGPIAAAALTSTTPEEIARVAYTVVGPLTIGKIMDKLLEEVDHKEYHRLSNAIVTSRQDSFLSALFERANIDKPHHIALMARLLAQYGKDHEKEPLKVNEDIGRQITTILEKWIKTLLASPDANRHQFADVIQAIERHPRTQFVPDMQKMLERNLTDWANAREEQKSARSRTLTPDVTHSHIDKYRRAFAAVGSEETIALMKQYLPDLRFQFGTDAAYILMDIWNHANTSHKDKRVVSRNDFSDVKALRALQDTQQSPETCDISESIFAVAKVLGQPDKDAANQQQAIKLGSIALSMPYGTKHAEIDALLALPQSYAAKRKLLKMAAIKGEILSANMLLAGLNELLELAKKEPWQLEESSERLMGWIELFAFSDRPLAVLEALNLLTSEQQHPRRLSRLLLALSQSPHDDTLQVLLELANRDPKMMKEYDWINAIIQIKTETSALKIIELICDGKIKASNALDGNYLVKQLCILAKCFPKAQQDILQRYKKMAGGPVKRMLKAALIEHAEASFVLAMIPSFAADNQGYDWILDQSIRKLAIGVRPADDWPGAFEQFSNELMDFRKKLFDMLVENGPQAIIAETCLIKIEEIRDEYGRINNEPRHPDIFSERPWPKEVEEPIPGHLFTS